MNDLYRQAVSLSFFAKGAAATVGVLIIHAAFRVLEKTQPQRFGRADARYKVRKLISEERSGEVPRRAIILVLWILRA
jgi:hypothetical protein